MSKIGNDAFMKQLFKIAFWKTVLLSISVLYALLDTGKGRHAKKVAF